MAVSGRNVCDRVERPEKPVWSEAGGTFVCRNDLSLTRSDLV